MMMMRIFIIIIIIIISKKDELGGIQLENVSEDSYKSPGVLNV